MVQILVVAVMFGVALLDASPVEACQCILPTTVQAVNNSDLVVMGRVVKAERVSPGLIRVEIAVEESFKGDSRWVYTRPRSASCYEYGFRVGEQYLIFASRPEKRTPELGLGDLPAGEYITGLCLGTVDLATTEGRDRLRAIRQQFEKR